LWCLVESSSRFVTWHLSHRSQTHRLTQHSDTHWNSPPDVHSGLDSLQRPHNFASGWLTMSAYAFPNMFQGLPPLGKSATVSDSLNELKAVTAPAPVPAPAPAPSTVTGIALPPLKLPINNRASDCYTTPTKHRNRRGSTNADSRPADPSIWVESANLNLLLLTMSPRKIVRRGSGGNGLAYSPRRQARTVGGNGILDAVEVILTITSSGRTYEATRSLARIVELSTDLIAVAMEEEDVAAVPILPDEIKLMTLTPPQSPGGGTLHLQNRLNSVRDALNVWFRRLLSSVDAPNSIPLSAFLWEPLWLTDRSASGGGSNSNGSGSGRSSGDVPLAESLSNDSSQSTNSGSSVAACSTNTHFNIGSPYSKGALPPLAFAPRSSWRPVRVRRGSADSVGTLSSIDETLLI